MKSITIAEDVRLDLGQTDLVGTLVFDGEELSLVAPSGSSRSLGHQLFSKAPGDVFAASEGRILIEEIGMARALVKALDDTGHFLETCRHHNLSAWGVDVVELLVIIPNGVLVGAGVSTESE